MWIKEEHNWRETHLKTSIRSLNASSSNSQLHSDLAMAETKGLSPRPENEAREGVTFARLSKH